MYMFIHGCRAYEDAPDLRVREHRWPDELAYSLATISLSPAVVTLFEQQGPLDIGATL